MSDAAPTTEGDYPVEVSFLPYEGGEYQKRLGRHRVLLLGESHYPLPGEEETLDVTREYTRGMFEKRVKNPGQGYRFRSLDQMLVGVEDPKEEDAVASWRRVSYINLSQRFAPNERGKRSAPFDHLHAGEEILVKHVLPRLRPTVIVVLGRRTWQAIQTAEEVKGQAYRAECVNRGGRRRYVESREIYRLPYEGGSAWMTWQYHHSINIEHWSDRVGALEYLLQFQPDS